MAHESFEDQTTADLMNKYFVNIKVDREERPDIDFIFQSSFQLFNQSGGGWPLTMFLKMKMEFLLWVELIFQSMSVMGYQLSKQYYKEYLMFTLSAKK